MTDEDFKKKLKDIDFDCEFTSLDSYKETLFELNKEFFEKKAKLNKLIHEKYEYSNYTYDRLLYAVYNLDKMFNNEYKSTLSIIQLAYRNNVVIDQVLKKKFKALITIIEKTGNLHDDLILDLNLSDSNANRESISIMESMDSLINDVKHYK